MSSNKKKAKGRGPNGSKDEEESQQDTELQRRLDKEGTEERDETIDNILLNPEDKSDFELDQLLDSAQASDRIVLDRRYDERDYQSHRRESFPHTHQPIRQHEKPRRKSSKTDQLRDRDRESSFDHQIELEPLVGPILVPVPADDYQEFSGGSPQKKVQFEIGGADSEVFSHEDLPRAERKKHRKHHHHHSRARQNSETYLQGTEWTPSMNFDFEDFIDMDDLDQENLSSHRFSDNKAYRRHKYSKVEADDPNATPALASKTPKYVHQPHEIFVELDVLTGHGELREWKEAARWIKYEEDVLEADRWGRPHVASLSFHSLINLRRLLEGGVMLMDLEERDLPGVAYRVTEELVRTDLIRAEDRTNVMRALLLKHKHVNESEGLWKFNLRRNTTITGSMHSLQAVLDQAGVGHNGKGMVGSSHTVPEGLNGGGLNNSPAKMARRNSAVSRLVTEDDEGHASITISEPAEPMAPLAGLGNDPAKWSLSNLSVDEMKWATNKDNLLRKIPVGAEASIVLVGKDDKLVKPMMAFVRLAESHYMPNITEVPVPVRFMFVLLGPSSFDLDYKEIGRSISTLMSNNHFHEIAYKATDHRDMLKGIHDFLDESIVLPPGDWDADMFPIEEMKEKRTVLKKRKDKEKRRMDGKGFDKSFTQSGELLVSDDGELRKRPSRESLKHEPLKRTNKAFGGLIMEVKKRYKVYASDLRDGLNLQTVAAIIFIYFACVSAAVALGGVMDKVTHKHIGIVEVLITTSFSTIIYSILSGQPLMIVGVTLPLLALDANLFQLCQIFHVDFLGLRFYMGIWIVLIGFSFVCFEGSFVAMYFTRFLQEIFGTLIALLFLIDAVKNIILVFENHPLIEVYGNCSNHSSSHFRVHLHSGPYPNTALWSTFLMISTFAIAYCCKMIRGSTFFTPGIRKFIGNFGVPIAIFVMVGIDLWMNKVTRSETLDLPDGVETLQNTKPRASWLIDVSKVMPGEAFTAFVPALFVFLLIFMESSIAAVIVNRKELKLRKGTGYHLDLMLICIINGGVACVGGCWVTAAAIRSVTHVNSLLVYSTNDPPGEKPTLLGVKEQRISNFTIGILLGVSVLMAPALRLVPIAVLFGVFIFMGISSMTGVQFIERIPLFLKEAVNHPQVPYVTKVRTWKMHLFTVIQLLCLGVLIVISQTRIALSIPFFLILVVPVRLFGLPKLFTSRELRALDGNADEQKSMDDDEFPKTTSSETLGWSASTTFSFENLHKQESQLSVGNGSTIISPDAVGSKDLTLPDAGKDR